ncbi:transketolase [Rubricoccus marinus]|uniref:Transketolase n=1 Tax=Rubricoccus marinus TaxID=716817 RepID=A0A259TX17_9BACT|nr:transketolase [Rubricoccus marinus]OZC02167.1 transketolase [Rubricoccus marinus]
MSDAPAPESAAPDSTAEGRTAEERQRLETAAATAIRGLTIDAIEKANSGHPGLPMGMADAAVVLWTRFLKHNPKAPDWVDRDRFVLSAGHGSMLIYSLLHLSGYDLTLDEIKDFRQIGSRTAGHPERHLLPGIETTTGPLGQGISTAVGLAMAEKHLAAQFNTGEHVVVDHMTYVIASDGDLQEGVSNEASSLAGHLGLGKLVVLYDDNHVSIDGQTDLSFSEDVAMRYDALGWHVVRDIDGHDNEAVARAIETARGTLDRPSLLQIKTTIGFGSPNLAGKADIHSDALGEAELNATKEHLGIPLEPLFHVAPEATTLFHEQAFRGSEAHCDWVGAMDAFREASGDEAAELERRLAGTLPEGWADALPTFEADAKGIATRAASGKVLDAIAPVLPELVGGSADLTPSNKTQAKGMEAFQFATPEGRYVHFGIREHGMGAALNGMALHGGIRPYGGTFLIFSDYMKPAVRLGALMETNPVFVYTHDSVALGEDGPTHQPIEQLAGLRAIPNLLVIRPADANETAAAWKVALEETDRPTALALTRQALPTMDLDAETVHAGVARGAYVVAEASGEAPDVILIASGSEVPLALAAREQLASDGVQARVISMPCDRLFLEQDEAYRESILPRSVRARVAVEAASPTGWGRFVGLDGAVVAIDRFGESGPGAEAYAHLGFTPEAVVTAARSVIDSLS